MAIWVRNLLYLFGLLFSAPLLVWQSWRTGKYRRGWRQKLLGASPADVTWSTGSPHESSGEVIWLHGVSVGEVQLLRSVIDSLRAARPAATLVLSTTTQSGMEVARRIMPADVVSVYFPLDFSWAVRRTLASIAPSLIVLGELELWPNLLAIATNQGIPVAVINGRLSDKSFIGYQRFQWLVRPMFAKLSWVAAQSEQYASRFRECGCRADLVEITGSIKFDNVIFDRQSPRVVELANLVGFTTNKPAGVIVAGSTQVEEEAAVVAAYVQLRNKWTEAKLVIVPRHPERFDRVFECLEETQRHEPKLKIRRRSDLSQPIDCQAWDILLVDTLGELSYWWGLADIALVGGSFGARGGQNMIEPAAFGANVVFGPNTSNFRDVVQLLKSVDGVTQLGCAAELAPWLEQQLTAPEMGQRRGAAASKLVAQQQGAERRTTEGLLRLLSTHESTSLQAASQDVARQA